MLSNPGSQATLAKSSKDRDRRRKGKKEDSAAVYDAKAMRNHVRGAGVDFGDREQRS